MKTRRYPSAALQLAIGCSLYTFALLGIVNNGGAGRVYPLVLCPYALFVYYVNRFLFRRERSLSLPTAINIALFLAVMVLTALTDGLGGAHWVFTTLFFALCTISGVHLARQDADLHLLLLALDAGVILLLIALVLVSTASLPLTQLLPAVLAVAASLSGVIVFRSGGEKHRANLVSVLLILLLTALLAALLLSTAQDIGTALLAVWHVIVSALRWLLRKLWQIVLFLISLFPAAAAEYTELAEPPSVTLPGEITETLPEPGTAFFIVVAALLAVGLFFLLMALRRIRLGKIRIGGDVSAAGRQGVSFRAALRQLWRTMRERARLRHYLRRHRNEPYALFYRLSALLRRTELRRRSEETPTNYLARLAAVSGDETLAGRLLALTDKVNAALYAPPSAACEFPDAAALRRGVQKLRRKLLFRNWKRRLSDFKKRTVISD